MNTLSYESEPKTDEAALDGDVTTLGSAGIAQLHHLRATEAALEGARAAYAATVVEHLRALPSLVRRQVAAQVLAEHALLATDPAVQALAIDLGIATTASTGTATSAAYERMEAVLPVVAQGLAELELARVELCHELGVESGPELPQRPIDVLAWLLDERVDPTTRAGELARGLRGLVTHVRAVREAGRASAFATMMETAPATIEARTSTPAWWPRVFRDSAVLAALRALHADTGRGSALADLHARRFARGYAERTAERR